MWTKTLLVIILVVVVLPAALLLGIYLGKTWVAR